MNLLRVQDSSRLTLRRSTMLPAHRVPDESDPAGQSTVHDVHDGRVPFDVNQKSSKKLNFPQPLAHARGKGQGGRIREPLGSPRGRLREAENERRSNHYPIT
jgi:hypothetical protein